MKNFENYEFGSKFSELDSSVKYNLPHIAKLVRAKIAEDKKLGLLPKFRSYVKVRTNSIDVNVKVTPDMVENGKLKQEVKVLERYINSIVDLWNYNDSDSSSDYFDRNYYSGVSFSS